MVELKALKGKFRLVVVDTFSNEDGFDSYFDTDEEAVSYAKATGGTMLKKHAYNKEGKHIGDGGTF